MYICIYIPIGDIFVDAQRGVFSIAHAGSGDWVERELNPRLLSNADERHDVKFARARLRALNALGNANNLNARASTRTAMWFQSSIHLIWRTFLKITNRLLAF